MNWRLLRRRRRIVIDQIAPFHARGGETALASGFPVSGQTPARQERYAGQVDFVERSATGCRRPRRRPRSTSSQLVAWPRAAHREKTLIHADLHLDNMLFDARGDGRSVTVLDWQTVSVGSRLGRRAVPLRIVERRGSRAAETSCSSLPRPPLTHGVREYTIEELRHDCGLALLLLLAGTSGG